MAACLGAASPAAAQITVGKGDQKVTLSGVVQPQYLLLKTPSTRAIDQVAFRRLFFQVLVAVNRDWAGEIQLDLGRSEVSVKNAYIQYTGWRDRGLLLTVGNQKPPFSRSFTTSGVKRSLTERPFTGDAHFGTLNRSLGVKVDGWTRGRHLQWSGMLASSVHVLSLTQLTFDSPANAGLLGDQGAIVVGRLEWHPLGPTPSEQGDFHTPAWRAVVGVAGYRWWRDGDRTAVLGVDLGSSRAFELSGGLRGHGVSLDAEFEPVRASAQSDAPAGGIFEGRLARLRKGSVEGSYMVVNHRLELAGGFDVLDADAYARAWRRTSAGVNWFLHDRAVEVQMTYRRNANVAGRPGTSLQETYVQMLLAF